MAGQGKEVMQGRRRGGQIGKRDCTEMSGREPGLLVKLVSQRGDWKTAQIFRFFASRFFSGLEGTTKLIR